MTSLRGAGYPDVVAGSESLLPDHTIIRLTRRELAVLEALAEGDAPLVDIAARLHVSPNTVKSQLRNVYRKLQVDNRGDALSVAVAQGLLDLETARLDGRAFSRARR